MTLVWWLLEAQRAPVVLASLASFVSLVEAGTGNCRTAEQVLLMDYYY